MASDLSPSILALASQIQGNTNVIQKHLTENSLPPPAFAADAFPFFPGTGPAGLDPFPRPDGAVVKARTELRQACETLLLLTTSPADHVIHYLCSYHNTVCLQYIYHFKIAENVPLDGSPISYGDLAKKTGTFESQLKRVVRFVMTNYYFHEPEPDHVAHTAGSKMLVAARDTIGYVTGETFVGAPSFSTVAEKFKGSEERNESAWNLGHGIDKPTFEYFETDNERMTRFLGHMKVLSGSEGWNIKHLISGYDWSSVGKGTVVDVGGGYGHACFAIAEVAKEADFVVQDMEKCVAGAKKYAREQGHTSERVKWAVHDFWTEQPVKDASVYLLRFILHDYPDKYAAQILKMIVPAMGKGSRIIVMDGVVPAPGLISKVDEKVTRMMDMEMMLTFNAVERDAEGWKALFAKADPRLTLKNIETPSGSAQSVMEVILE